MDLRDESIGEDDLRNLTFFDVGLDDVTLARLIEVCESCKAPPSAVIAAIVRDVMEDDAQQHDPAVGNDEIVRRNSNHDLN